MSQLATLIEQAFEDRANYSSTNCPADIRSAVEEALAGLDNGSLRVAEKKDGEWVVNQWLKKAVLLSFKLNDNKPIESCDLRFYDKVDTSLMVGQKHNSNKLACVLFRLLWHVKVLSKQKM